MIGFLVGGETLGHNYHHKFPNSPRSGLPGSIRDSGLPHASFEAGRLRNWPLPRISLP